MPPEEVEAVARCIERGGVGVFPSDTVYGLACDPERRSAVERLYALKGRAADKPSAVMFFDRKVAIEALPELGPRTSQALSRLLPGPVTVLLANPRRRFSLACGADPGTLGLRVPLVDALAGLPRPVLQSSANPAGGRDARRLDEVPAEIRNAADVVLDGGTLPGTPSTVVDLREYEEGGAWDVVREGAEPRERLQRALSSEA